MSVPKGKGQGAKGSAFSIPPHKIAQGRALHAGRMMRELFTRGCEPTPKLYRHLRGHRGSINSISFHPINSIVISGGSEGWIYLWDYVSLTKRALRFVGHTGAVRDVTFNSTGDLILSASDDLSIGIWVPLIRGEFRYLRGHSAPVRSVAFNPVQRDYFISASDDKTVKLWNLEWSKSKQKTSLKSHDFVRSWCCHNNWVKSVRFNSYGTSAITASDDRTVNVLDIRTTEETLKLTIGKGVPVHADFNNSAPNYFGVATTDEFHIYDIRNGKMVQCYKDIHTKDITGFGFHPCGDFATTVAEDQTVKILDVIEGRPVFTMFGHSQGVTSVSFSTDGMVIGSGGRDSRLLIWEPVVIPYGTEELEAHGIVDLSLLTPSSPPASLATNENQETSATENENNTSGSGSDTQNKENVFHEGE